MTECLVEITTTVPGPRGRPHDHSASALGANGIRVSTVAPGPTRTDGCRHTPRRGERLGSATPLSRSADPNEIAEAIVFLASPQASYPTGATVAVDGSLTAI